MRSVHRSVGGGAVHHPAVTTPAAESSYKNVRVVEERRASGLLATSTRLDIRWLINYCLSANSGQTRRYYEIITT